MVTTFQELEQQSKVVQFILLPLYTPFCAAHIAAVVVTHSPFMQQAPVVGAVAHGSGVQAELLPL
jgi:hypothetical protein